MITIKGGMGIRMLLQLGQVISWVNWATGRGECRTQSNEKSLVRASLAHTRRFSMAWWRLWFRSMMHCKKFYSTLSDTFVTHHDVLSWAGCRISYFAPPCSVWRRSIMRLDLEGSTTLNVTTCSLIALVASLWILLIIVRSSELSSELEDGFAKEAITKLSDAPAKRFALASFYNHTEAKCTWRVIT